MLTKVGVTARSWSARTARARGKSWSRRRGGTVPAIGQTQSREWTPREERVCGLPRERNGLHCAELAAVVTKEDGVGGGVSDTRLARNGCRESGVARCPLAVW